MSKEHPFILFAGTLERGQALSSAAEERGWFVMVAEEDLEALAMYAVYIPDIVVVEQNTQMADQVVFHLHSVEAECLVMSHPLDGLDLEMFLDTIVARPSRILLERESEC
jgi:hypothetical protein